MDQLPKGSIVTNEDAYKEVDHAIGDNYKFAGPRQRLCFEPDTYENIRTEFDRFVKENPPVKSFVDTN